MLHEIDRLSPFRQIKWSVKWSHGLYIFNRALHMISSYLLCLYVLDYKEEPDSFSTILSDSRAMKRDCHRFWSFIPNLRVLNMIIERKVLCTSLAEQMFPPFSEKTQKVWNLYHRQQYNVPQGLNIHSALLSSVWKCWFNFFAASYEPVFILRYCSTNIRHIQHIQCSKGDQYSKIILWKTIQLWKWWMGKEWKKETTRRRIQKCVDRNETQQPVFN